MRRLLLCLSLLFSLGALPVHAQSQALGVVAAQQAAKPAAEDTDRQIRDLVDTLENDADRARLVAQLKTLLAAQNRAEDAGAEAHRSVGGRVMDFVSSRIANLSASFTAIGGSFNDLPNSLHWLRGQVRTAPLRNAWVRALAPLVLVLIVGLALQRLIRRACRPTFKRLSHAEAPLGALQRIGRRIARLFIDLLPPAVFALAGYAVVALYPRLVGSVQETISFTTFALIHATILVHVVLAAARTVLAPSAPVLRMVRIGDETAAYVYVWIRRLAYTGAYGYFLAVAAAVLGAPDGVRHGFMVLVALLVTALVFILILQNRRAVADWLRHDQPAAVPLAAPADGEDDGSAMGAAPEEFVALGDPPPGHAATPAPGGVVRQLRRRLADIWHILAIAYIGIAFLIWALRVEGGFEYMARGTLLSVLVLVLAKGATRLVARGVDRGLSLPDDLRRQFPNLEARANGYLPVLRRILGGVISLIAAVGVLRAWGLDALQLLETPLGERLIASALSILVALGLAVIAWEIVNTGIERYLNARTADGNLVQRSARIRTLLPLLRNAVSIVLVTVVALIALSELGVNIAPLLAGAGVIGLAIGFGAQTLVKDVITGLFMLLEDTVSVGDVVDVGGGHSGVVEAISVRALRLRDQEGTVHTIPFSNVATVRNMTKDFAFHVGRLRVAFTQDVDQVTGVLRDEGFKLLSDPKFAPSMLEPVEILGIERFDQSALIVLYRIKTPPFKQWDIGREFNRRIKMRLDAEGIAIPVPEAKVTHFGDLAAMAAGVKNPNPPLS